MFERGKSNGTHDLAAAGRANRGKSPWRIGHCDTPRARAIRKAYQQKQSQGQAPAAPENAAGAKGADHG